MRLLDDGPPPPSPQEVREALAGVLPERSLLDRALDPVRRVFDWIGDRLPSLDVGNPNVPSGGISAVGYLIIGVLVVVLIGLIVLAVRRWVSVPSTKSTDDDGPTVVTEELDDPGLLASEADGLLADGRYRDALLMTYRQTVAELVVRNWVPRSRARTTGELRGDVSAGLADVADVADEFDALTTSFEEAWFGAFEVDAQMVQSARQRGESVTAAAISAGRAPTPVDRDRRVEVIEL